MVWVEYLICAVLILVSGSLLSRYGDMLAEKTGMGRTWIGLILLATVTSLPELGTGISAITMAAAPDIAVGDVLGSCVFNLMLIGVIDLFYRPMPILSKVDPGHALSAGFGILLVGLAAWGLLLGHQGGPGTGFWIGPSTPLVLLFYFIAVRMIFNYEKKRMNSYREAQEKQLLRYGDVSIQKVYMQVLFHASVVVGAGVWLAFIGNRLAEATGLGTTFVGNLLIAASTSLPEIVTSFTALRLAAPDLAIANLFGSNLFNMVVLSVDDILFLKGPLLSHVSFNHQVSALSALMMTGIALTGLVYRTRKTAWATLSWDGLALLVIYFVNAYLMYTFGMRGE
jgi:cation:H+ antiporter